MKTEGQKNGRRDWKERKIEMKWNATGLKIALDQKHEREYKEMKNVLWWGGKKGNSREKVVEEIREIEQLWTLWLSN